MIRLSMHPRIERRGENDLSLLQDAKARQLLLFDLFSSQSDNSTLQGKVSSLSAFQASVGTTLCDMTKSMEEVVGNLEATKLCLVAAQTEGDSLREKVAALEDTNEK